MAYKFQLGDARLSGSLIQEGSIQSSGEIVPLSADGAALGSATKEWADLYLADGGRILFGSDQDTWITQTGGGFRIEGGSETTGQPVVSLVNRGNFASGPGMNFVIDNGAGEGDGDIMGFLNFYGDDSSDAQVQYARLEVQSVDVSNGTEDGAFFFNAIVGGSGNTTLLDINSTIAGGVAVANDLEVGDDLFLKSDDSAIHFGADSEIRMDHRPDAGIRIEQTGTGTGLPSFSLVNRGNNANGPIINIVQVQGDGEASDNDVLGALQFFGQNVKAGTDEQVKYGKIEVLSKDVTDGTEDGGIRFSAFVAGSETQLMDINDSLAGGVQVANGLNVQGHDGSSVGLRLAGTLVTSTAAELNLLDGVSGLVKADFTKLAAVDASAAELNLLDGDTSVGSSITIVDSDGVIMNDGGTMKSVPASDFKTYLAGLAVSLKDNTDTLSNGVNYFADLSGAEAVSLPASPDVGDNIYVKAPSNCSISDSLTINRQGSHTIDGLTSIVLESPNAAVMLVYVAANLWKVF